MNDEQLQEFLKKLEELLQVYNVTITSDNMGDMNLDYKNKTIGYWPCKLNVKSFESWL